MHILPAGGLAQGGVEPVSYTHLDVYKRQVLFSHTYHYIGMEPVRGLYEFESDDPDPGEFTYFFLAPDTSAETYHIEFRYGSDAEAPVSYTHLKIRISFLLHFGKQPA